MTTITGTEANAILERLTDKTLSFGQEIMVFKKLRGYPDGKWFHETITDVKWHRGYACVDHSNLSLKCRSNPPCEDCGNDPKLLNDINCTERFCNDCARKREVCKICSRQMKILGHKVLIGDVLERLTKFEGSLDAELLGYWRPFGFKTPLRNILEMIEWEVRWVKCGSVTGTKNKVGGAERKELIAKPSPATNLFIFLKQIGL